jgi:hypothetical protein
MPALSNRKRVRLPAAVPLGVFLSIASVAGAAEAPEYQVKAAFLHKFALFVEWPTNAFADARSPLIVGVLGESPFGPLLELEMKDATVQDRPIRVERCRGIEEAGNCHVLFISASEHKRLTEIANALRSRPVLTVGEGGSFCQGGGMIGFTLVEKKVRFEINTDAAHRAGLQISSQLMQVAGKVWPALPEGGK